MGVKLDRAQRWPTQMKNRAMTQSHRLTGQDRTTQWDVKSCRIMQRRSGNSEERRERGREGKVYKCWR